MKTTTTHSEKNPDTLYPFIGISNAGKSTEITVMFSHPSSGMIIATPTPRLGETSDCWAMDQFTPLNGTVTITQ
jgi:hypothetical protein